MMSTRLTLFLCSLTLGGAVAAQPNVVSPELASLVQEMVNNKTHELAVHEFALEARLVQNQERIRLLEESLLGERRLQDYATLSASINTMKGELDASVDTVWILAAGLICFFLQAGFGMLEAGAVRAKNTKSIMLKNLMDAVVGGMVYYLFGYGLAYGGPGDGTGNDFIGWGNFALAPASEQDYLSWFFQYVFAATIATIVSGAVAERIQFQAYMIYSIVLTGVIYPIASHWIWCADGFLYKMGVIDYAGGGAVHALSGVAAFMAALALGPRHGRFSEDGKPIEIAPHNVGMMALGVFILWFGFIPFNAGSGLSVGGSMAGQTTRIAVITTLGGCSGGITALLLGLAVTKHCSLEYAMNGVLAGMVAVCSCCAVVAVWHVFFIISPLATLFFFALHKLQEKIKVDDPLGASSLHFGPGIVGLIAVGFLAVPEYTEAAYGCDWPSREGDTCDDFIGLFYGGSGKQLGYQLLAGAIWCIWGIVTCGILFYGMKAAGVLRVSLEDEINGIDITHHGGPAYDTYESPIKKYIAQDRVEVQIEGQGEAQKQDSVVV